MIEEYVKENKCCGCMACVNICPKYAITVIENSEGFKAPKVNKDKCVDCGLCNKVCGFNNEQINEIYEKEIYACQNKDENILLNSTSGGMFYNIANRIIDSGGYVAGAIFNEDLKVEHIISNNLDDIRKMQGAKYVQSDISSIYKPIEDKLTEGRSVLFTGTPCQVNAIKNYFNVKNINTDNLYLADIICHSVPSPKIFREYKQLLEKKYKSKIDFYSFRYKPMGWRGTNVFVRFKNGKEIKNTLLLNTFVNLFFGHNIVRSSCFVCPYANMNRVSDITMGDFWGIEDVSPKMNTGKGTSMVLVNTAKGKDVFDIINVDFDIEKIDSNIEFKKQPQLYAPVKMPKNRELFWQEYNKKGFRFIISKYAGYSLKNRLYRFLKNKNRS